MTSSGPSDAELAKQYWKRQALKIRGELEEHNPTFAKPSAGAKTFEPIQQAAVAGASTRAFMEAFQGNGSGNKSQPVMSDPAGAKARIVEALVKQGKSGEHIQDVLDRVSPHIDIFSMTSDPAVQSILLQRLMNGNQGQNFGLRDLVEALKLVETVRAPQQQPQTTDAGQLANALATAMKSGVEAAKSNSNNSDPTTVLKIITDNQRESHAQQLQMYERLLDSQQPRSLREQLEDLRGVSDSLGKIAGKESEAVTLKRIEMENQRWAKQTDIDADIRKARGQTEMIKTITGNLQKALESPVVRELGKNVGKKLPGAETFSQARVNSAQAEIRNPTETPWQFTCPRCKTSHTFTTKDLTMINERGGRWVCTGTIDGKPCSETYQLRNPGGSSPDDRKDRPSVA
jgi:hypothetical protein